MDVKRILSELDAEIQRLEKIREALNSIGSVSPADKPKGKRGRPKGSKNGGKAASVEAATAAKTTRKRKLSPEGRKKIAEAMKRRWANYRKTAS